MIIVYMWFALMASSIFAQGTKTIILSPPDTTRGLPFIKALSQRASQREFDTTSLKIQDLSDLLWAANGINRPEAEKRTAPSAQNAQDIDVYVFMKSGVYLYDAKIHVLDLVVDNDHRNLFAGRQDNAATPPVIFFSI